MWRRRLLALPLVGLATAGCIGTLGDNPGGGAVGPGSCGPIQPGPSAIRRMTRVEYDNTVRDLLADTSRPAQLLPPDELGPVGFNNNAINLKVSDVLTELYMKAAEGVAARATADLAALLPCDPAADQDGCAQAFIAAFGKKAFRRPLSDDELTRYQGLYQTGKTQWDFKTGIELVIQGMLQSPHFLYRVEFGEGQDDRVRKLTGWEMASRLSYFLWNSMPDATLFDAAEAGELGTPAQVSDAARRMLADERARASIDNFHEQWLRLGSLGTLTKDTTIFPTYYPAVRDLYLEEVRRFVEEVVSQPGGNLGTLLTASFTMLNGELASFYGVEGGPSGDAWERVNLDGAQHAGLLTLGGVLATHAKPNQTSPVLRGKLVREQLLCQMMPPPPDDVDITPPDLDPGLTTRDRYDMHRIEPCAGCHNLMDPIGFGFEHFDALGLWRDTENGLTIDASGEVMQWDLPGAFDGVTDLGQKLVASAEVQACVVTQWFRYANGRNESEGDNCQLGGLTDAFVESGLDLKELLVMLTQTDAFLYRSVEAP